MQYLYHHFPIQTQIDINTFINTTTVYIIANINYITTQTKQKPLAKHKSVTPTYAYNKMISHTLLYVFPYQFKLKIHSNKNKQQQINKMCLHCYSVASTTNYTHILAINKWTLHILTLIVNRNHWLGCQLKQQSFP